MTQFSKAVMDVSPGPNSMAFADADLWWEYIWGCDERARLNHLLVAALLNTDIRKRLLEHDTVLLESFHLSEQTIVCIRDIEARGLNAFTAELLGKLAAPPVAT